MAERGAPAAWRLAVHVQPRAAREQVAGFQGQELKLRVAAPAVEGAANEACQALVARLFRLRPGQVRVVRGARARHKLLALDGDPAWLDRRLAELRAGGADGAAP